MVHIPVRSKLDSDTRNPLNVVIFVRQLQEILGKTALCFHNNTWSCKVCPSFGFLVHSRHNFNLSRTSTQVKTLSSA